ncbi:MAG: DUF6691 family protein [Gammaproteobacteria bacterium]
MIKLLVALTSGIVFGFGLSLSQMINPKKVLDFLDIFGNWDPSLAFVMIGALSVALISFRWVLKKPHPFFESGFHITHKTAIDKPLILGAMVFGIGWGLSGYCPGPAVAGLGVGNLEALIMVGSIYLGFFSQRYLEKRQTDTIKNTAGGA